MSSSKLLKISTAATFFLVFLIIALFVYDKDRPLGEGYKSFDQYGGEFQINGASGPIKLSDFEDKIVIVYFGFVHCRNACPVSLAKLKKAYERLSDDEIKNVVTLFISIDPERDNPKEADDYVKKYNPLFIGLSDSRANIDALQNQYGVFATKDSLNGEGTTYTVDHSSRFYIVDRKGKLNTTMSHSTTSAELVAKIQSLL